MFYFSKISSGFNLSRYEKKSNIDLIKLRLDLELYVHWKTIFNSECKHDDININNDESNDVYEDLLEYIKINIFDKNKSLQERYDEFIRR